MSFFIKHVEGLLSMDWATLASSPCSARLAAYFIKEYLANPPMIIFVYPVLVSSRCLAQYLFMLAELYPPKEARPVADVDDPGLDLRHDLLGTVPGRLRSASCASSRPGAAQLGRRKNA